MLKKFAISNEHESLQRNAESALTNRLCMQSMGAGRACEMSPHMHDDSERHQFKIVTTAVNNYGDTMPLV